MSASDNLQPKQYPRSVVSTVSFRSASGKARIWNATNNMTGETHEGISQAQLNGVVKKAVSHAKSQGIDVDEFGRAPAGTKFPGEQ